MAANPGDIAYYTNDGVVLTAPADPAVSAAIIGDIIDAQVTSDPLSYFFDVAGDAQAMLNERFSYQSEAGPVHIGAEVQGAMPFGKAISYTQAVPTIGIVDDSESINTTARLRSWVLDTATDRYSLELLR